MVGRDGYERLTQACRDSANYPANLIRSKAFRHALVSYCDRLADDKDRLFDSNPEYTLVEFLEAGNGQDGFSTTKCTALEALQNHLESCQPNPICRHVFLEADHSRAPLDCSFEMFTYLMTFLQAMAPILDPLSAFGRQHQRRDFHYTSFQQENQLGAADSEKFAIPHLGRSGRQLQLCYNLWSVERSDAGGSPWSIRQTVMCHSFDVETGGALWINISTNDQMKSRINDAVCSCDPLRSEVLGTLSSAFAATLMTHRIALEWCSEGWRQYISSLEAKLKDILIKVNNVPIDDVERMLAVDSTALLEPFRGGTTKYRVLSGLTTATNMNASRIPSQPLSLVPQGLQQSISPSPPANATEGLPFGEGKWKGDRNPFDILRDFSLDSLQHLNSIGSELQTANMVMKLNRDIMTQQVDYNLTLLGDDEFPEEIKTGCARHIAEFSRGVKDIVRSFEMEAARIKTLMLLLADGRDLFDKIWQFRNIETSKLFAINAHQSAARMEEMTAEMHNSTINMESLTQSMHSIAEKTGNETASMHIITLVTLIFLPGTFVATFLGSGLFQWDENEPSQKFPAWRPQFFALFAKICFPLMGATTFIWLLAYCWPKVGPVRRRRFGLGRESWPPQAATEKEG